MDFSSEMRKVQLHRRHQFGRLISGWRYHAITLRPIPLLQRNRFKVPPLLLKTSRPQLPPSVAALMLPAPPRLLSVSWRPTSLPMTYPAPKPTTETSTTTPALTTHVRRVGLIKKASSLATVLFFLVARGGLEAGVGVAARLTFSLAVGAGGEEGGALVRAGWVEPRDGAGGGEGPISSLSAAKRSATG